MVRCGTERARDRMDALGLCAMPYFVGPWDVVDS